MTHQWLKKFVAVACLPTALGACNAKGDLSAYLHKTDAAPEPAASTAPGRTASAT